MVTLTPRGTNWVLAALFVSLALNMFVAGLVVAHKLRHGPHGVGEWQQRGDNERPMHGFIDRLAGNLSPDDRGKFMAAIGDYRAEMTIADQAMRQARNKVHDAMAADPFDRNALETAFGEVRARMQDVQKIVHTAIADAAARLSPESRKSLSNWDRKDQGKDKDQDKDQGRDQDK
jgi:uncharacterized membrane protein